MTTRFVFSGAAGANDGTSWANAWTSEASSVGAAAGDIIKCHKTHNGANNGANVNWSNGVLSNLVELISVDKDAGDALAPGATFNWNVTNTGPQGNIVASGISFKTSAANLRQSPPALGYQRYENCTFSSTGATGLDFTAGAARYRVDWINCNVDFSGASNAAISLSLASISGFFNWSGGTYACRSTQTNLFTAPVSFSGVMTIRGVNFSGTVTNLFNASAGIGGVFNFEGCSAPVYTNVYLSGGTPTGFSHRINLDGFVNGTVTTALLQPTLQANSIGTLTESATSFRQFGADQLGDELQPHSLKIVSTTNAANQIVAFETPFITRLVAAGTQTIVFYLAADVQLTNAEFWVEVFSPSEAATPTGLARFQSSRCDLLATPVNLSSDTDSHWAGSGVTIMQKVTMTIAPTLPGIVYARFCLGRPSATVYVDPEVVVI